MCNRPRGVKERVAVNASYLEDLLVEVLLSWTKMGDLLCERMVVDVSMRRVRDPAGRPVDCWGCFGGFRNLCQFLRIVSRSLKGHQVIEDTVMLFQHAAKVGIALLSQNLGGGMIVIDYFSTSELRFPHFEISVPVVIVKRANRSLRFERPTVARLNKSFDSASWLLPGMVRKVCRPQWWHGCLWICCETNAYSA